MVSDIVIGDRVRLIAPSPILALRSVFGTVTGLDSHGGYLLVHLDAPADYIDAMLRAIVGFEIPLTTLTGKWKMSQNRSAADREGIAAGLAAEADRRST